MSIEENESCKFSGVYCADCAKLNCKERVEKYNYLANADPHDLVGGHNFIFEDGEEHCIYCLKSKRRIERENNA